MGMKTFCASFFDGLGLGPLWRMVDRALVANNERTSMVDSNARLIAAAPYLLDALRDLVDVVTGHMDGETVALHNALAAIHKATGRPA